MDDTRAVTTTDQPGVIPFSFDFGSEFIKENLPAEKKTELALVAQNRRMDLAQDVAERTIRLQASSVDMDQTLNKAHELSRVRAISSFGPSIRRPAGRRKSPSAAIRQLFGSPLPSPD